MQYRDPSTGNFKELYFKGGDTLPIGSILAFGNNTPPTNWLICDGSAVSRTAYADLFAVIGTSFGTGDGSTTFNLPDLRSRVPLGKDSRDTDFDTIGETYGEKTHTLTIAEMPEHNHQQRLGTGSGTWGSLFGVVEGTGPNVVLETETYNKGGDGAHNNVQPSLVTNYIIKVFQTSGVVGNVTNLKNNSQQDTYSCAYINNKVSTLIKTNEILELDLDSGDTYQLNLPPNTLFVEPLVNSDGSRYSGGVFLVPGGSYTYLTNNSNTNQYRGIYVVVEQSGLVRISEFRHNGSKIAGFRIWYLDV